MTQHFQADVTHELLKGIYKKNFISIEYINFKGELKKYWIGINDIDVQNRKLSVFGFNVNSKQCADFDYPISLDSIKNAQSIDETYYETEKSENLRSEIKNNPDKFVSIFNGKTENLKILDYLEECVQLNNTPYIPDEKFSLLETIDDSKLKNDSVQLTVEQFNEVIEKIDKKLLTSV